MNIFFSVTDDTYAWLVVFILPLNSAVNPLLYTFTTPKYRNQVLLRGWHKFTSRRRTEGSGNSNPGKDQSKHSLTLKVVLVLSKQWFEIKASIDTWTIFHFRWVSRKDNSTPLPNGQQQPVERLAYVRVPIILKKTLILEPHLQPLYTIRYVNLI